MVWLISCFSSTNRIEKLMGFEVMRRASHKNVEGVLEFVFSAVHGMTNQDVNQGMHLGCVPQLKAN